MFSYKLQKNKGFSFLYIALIIASITTAAAFIFSSGSMNSVRIVRLVEQKFSFSNTFTACSERVLMEVRNAPEASITGSFSLDDGVCEYTINGSVPNKIVTIRYEKGTKEMQQQITITATNPVIIFE